jgi:transposase
VIRPSGDVRIHLYRQPVDMMKAINGLVSIAEGEMGSDPFSADLFVFCNRARTLVKMVVWEGNGFVLWMKRLEKSRFKWPLSGSEGVLQLTVQEINWRVGGGYRTLEGGADTDDVYSFGWLHYAVLDVRYQF